MPKLSHIKRYKVGDCFEVILDISDAPAATFERATFSRSGAEVDWPLLRTKKLGLAEYRLPPDLLILYLIPGLPDGQVDDPAQPVLGRLEVFLKSNGTMLPGIRIQVACTPYTVCDICEATENAMGVT
jgi:hypothetical protein